MANLDKIGIMASSLCALHCAFLPLLLTVSPLLSLGFLNDPWIELSLLGFTLCVGLTSLLVAYFKFHRKKLPLFILFTGFLCILSGHLLENEIFEPAVVSAGGFMIAVAHLKNWKFTRRRMIKASVTKNYEPV